MMNVTQLNNYNNNNSRIRMMYIKYKFANIFEKILLFATCLNCISHPIDVVKEYWFSNEFTYLCI